jgi:hypothetical protein
MYRLSCNITDEAVQILKAEAKRLGTGMGTIITMMLLDRDKESRVLKMADMYDQVLAAIPKADEDK